MGNDFVHVLAGSERLTTSNLGVIQFLPHVAAIVVLAAAHGLTTIEPALFFTEKLRIVGCSDVMSKTINAKTLKYTRRSGEAVSAMRRNSAGPMRHRLQPRGGAKNAQASYFDEIIGDDESSWFDEDRDG
jgi:hypothetical protein